jgi:hypothetical protein
MMNTDKKNDKLKNENKNKTMNEGAKVPNIHPTAKREEDDNLSSSGEEDQAGRTTGNQPKSGGRQGGKSVEDGGQDVGSSAGGH